ncbi:hypothetical protein [Aquisphaera insulae]|uniref:hypothetical protein n=1 Tax=Aquisphaera insulae TaxID=2712864 RepID=UPI0013ECB0A0|nr:hypothetical protein [Aquisphaera insulae]
MESRRRRIDVATATLAAIMMGVMGCSDGGPAKRSPTSEEDPARHEAAVKAAEAKARADQEAEGKAMRKARRSTPNP